MWPGRPFLEGRDSRSFSKSKTLQGLALLWKISILFVWILGITKLENERKVKTNSGGGSNSIIAPSCLNCLFSVVLQGSQLPSRDLWNSEKKLGQVPLFTAIHVCHARESTFNLNAGRNEGIIEETVISFAMLTIPVRQGLLRPRRPNFYTLLQFLPQRHWKLRI